MSRPTKLRFLGEKIGSSRDGPRQQSPLSLPLLPFRTGRHSAAESWGVPHGTIRSIPGLYPADARGTPARHENRSELYPDIATCHRSGSGRGRGIAKLRATLTASRAECSHLPTRGRDASWGFLARQPGWPSEGLEPSVLGRGAGAGSSCIKTRLVT